VFSSGRYVRLDLLVLKLKSFLSFPSLGGEKNWIEDAVPDNSAGQQPRFAAGLVYSGVRGEPPDARTFLPHH